MKASSESGECASLISTVLSRSSKLFVGQHERVHFLFRCDTARPGHSMRNSKRLPPLALVLPRELSRRGEVYRRRTEKTCASQELAWR